MPRLPLDIGDEIDALARQDMVKAGPDVFEESRATRCVNDTDGDGDCAACARYGDASPCRQRETRAEAKTRLMLAAFSESRRLMDEEITALQARYVWVKEFVQIDGRPYSTHNHMHFWNRYSSGRRVPVYRVGLYRETLRECMVWEAKENGARRTLRLLSH